MGRKASTITRVAIALLAGALLVAWPALAGAQDATAPVVEVQFLVDGEDGSGFLLVTGTLDPDASLPTTISLPVPDGAEVWWAGEITGGGSTEDIERQAIGVPGEGGLVLEMRLEETRTGQYDALYLPTTSAGDIRETALRWVQSSPASQLQFSVVFPVGADDVEMDPEPASGPVTNRAGESLYLLPTIEAPDLGSEHSVSVSYLSGTILGERVLGADDGPSGVLIVLGAFVALLAVVLVVVLRSQLGRHDDEGEEDIADDEYALSEE